MSHPTESDDVSGVNGPFSLSPKAIERVRFLLEKESRPQGAGLRVGVINGGCSGMQYTLGFDDAPGESDTVADFEDVRVFIDSESLPYVEGTLLDFADGLHAAGFKFSNPNADRTCGCGSSFSV